MNVYTAISIGPIIATLSQVRKPRHLWSGSYIFSHLMGIIIDEGEKSGGKLISPAKDTDTEKTGIGLYPDRAFFEGKVNLKLLTDNVLAVFSKSINIEAENINSYFNIMGVSINAAAESEAIPELNKKLDVLELSNRCEESSDRELILDLISSANKETTLYELAFESGELPVNTLAEIASVEIRHNYPNEWENASNLDRLAGKMLSKKNRRLLTEEDLFYMKLQEAISDKLMSYHKYFCVVQADGDNMGKVIGNLQDGKLNELSKALITFGKAASQKVKEFGGLPVYAGGDDLLFIAPVVSELKMNQCDNVLNIKANIFELIDEIDSLYKTVKTSAAELQREKDKADTSMSYGISINYYKYPLYEVLENARHLLFDIAKINRNSIACELRKHSGSSFNLVLHKTNENLKQSFEELIKITVEESIVSATAHKLRGNNTLWLSTNGEEARINAFFKKIMGLGEKKTSEDNYLERVKIILTLLIKDRNENLPDLCKKALDASFTQKYEINLLEYLPKNKVEQHELDNVKDKIKKETETKIYKDCNERENERINQFIYSMVRTAKFINGEEVKDE